jgi:peroxiredoxin
MPWWLCAFMLVYANAESAWGQYLPGHSHLGAASDEGPRQKPVKWTGIGQVHFPITHEKAETQEWFNQGVALLHNFWFYEAERTFRWCRKLEPDNPMVWWGLAMSAERDSLRGTDFIREAWKRRGKASERERLYIESAYAVLVEDPLKPAGWEERRAAAVEKLESITVKYPDDTEAKAFLALYWMGEEKAGSQALLEAVLAKNPRHPGAHHYRIHNWNYHEATSVLDSARLYGEIAPDSGHALHMPGHIYSELGMWHEAAISMDAATRAEMRYMQQNLTFPHNEWNYAHNKNYLARIQEQLGMERAALDGARQLIEAPLDPKYNNEEARSTHSQGLSALARGFLKFRRWKALLEEGTAGLRDIPREKVLKAYLRTRAQIGMGELDAAFEEYAEFQKLEKEIEKDEHLKGRWLIQSKELRGRLMVLRGDRLGGLALVAQAAVEQFPRRPGEVELLFHPEVLWGSLGDLYLEQKTPSLAVDAYEKALTITRVDGFALAGLVRAHHALGETEKSRARMSELLSVWSDADAGVAAFELAKATGLQAAPRDPSPERQRNYTRITLERFGPNRWMPYAAPVLQAEDAQGRTVTLSEYRGKNVVVVFYLGDQCVHCMEQLAKLGKRKAEFEQENTVLLGVSRDAPDRNRESLKAGEVALRLLSDVKLENAKRWRSYDDFEEVELHSTVLVDGEGKVRWARTGGAPFTDLDFLLKEIRRVNGMKGKVASKAD